MRVFCTLFNTNYLSRGLAMYYSLARNNSDFHLFMFAFDANCEKILREMRLKSVTVIGLEEFEDKKLLAVKAGRSVAEYCWTCTSSTILYVLDNFNVSECTYIDADLYFYSSVEPIFTELGQDSILLTEHRFSPEFAKDIIKGKYCVQFVTFKNDQYGRKALTWWRQQCLDWCYARLEDGKFGDQGYLNDWTTRFEKVHVLDHLGGGVAIWNVQQYKLRKENEKIIGAEMSTGNDFDLIFYHFHYLRFLTNGKLEFGRRFLDPAVLDYLYRPYVKELERIRIDLEKKYPGIDPHGIQKTSFTWKTPVIYLYRKIKGVYNVYNKEKFIDSVKG